MGTNVEVKNYPKLQQISKNGKERISSPRGSQSIKFPDKLKVENRQCLQNVCQHREPEENLDARAICQNNSGNQQKQFLKGKVTKDDELVKHMKNLPGYLQSMEKGENLQGNALNVGVLDWARLEKWKPSQNCDFRKGRFSSSLSGTDKSLNIPKGSLSLPSDARTETLAQKSKLRASASFGPCSSGKDGLSQCPRPANRKFMCTQDAENVSNFTLDEKMKKKLASTYESSEGNHSNIKRKTGRTEEGRRTASGTNNPSNLKNHKKFLSSKDNFRGFDAHAVKKVVEIPQLVSKENYVEPKNTSGIGASSSSKSGKLEVPLIAKQDEINEKVDGPRDSDIHLDYKFSSGKQKSIVLLLPKRFPKSNLAEMSQQNDIIRVSAQSSCRVNQSSFSGSLLSEEHSTELCPEIPYSCPLPSHDTTPREILHRPVMLSPDSSPHFPSFSGSLLSEEHSTELCPEIPYSCPLLSHDTTPHEILHRPVMLSPDSSPHFPSFSGSLLSEEHSTELCPEIPYSCPLPSHDTTPHEILHRPVMLSPGSSPHFPSFSGSLLCKEHSTELCCPEIPYSCPLLSHDTTPREILHRPVMLSPDSSPYFPSFSGSLLSEEHSTELCPEIPYSCPLPSHDTTPREILHRPVMLSPDSSPHFPSLKKLPDIPSEVKCGQKHRSSSALLNQNLAANLKILALEAAEMESRRGSNSSPNRRFSFSLGRMRRSFSFKENTSVPQLSSTYVSAKSGPVGTGDAPCLDILSHDKVNVPTRSRSSPLRRLLDPLLKSRSANSHSSAENITPLKGKLHSMSPRPITANELLVVDKHDESKVQALLQLTMKNGLPLFKFVVDNNSSILAATMKDSPLSGKDGAGRSYTFYSVNEIKKRGGWMGQGSKVKSGDFEYSVVGQMQVSDESFSHLAAESFGEHSITREFVLSGARQADAELPDFLPIRELAAIVFKIGADNIRCDGEQADCCKYSSNWNPEDSLRERNRHFKFANSNHRPSCATVILPRGVHALPNKGEPSPLIYRWKSGGSCDCGGWDIGCKLRVLSNQNTFSNTPNSKACSISDCLELFVQGEAQLKSPIFRLAPFRKGIYSIEFDSSISLLQAFSISVAVLSCQTSSDPSEGDCSPEISTVGELALNRNVPMKAPSMIKRGRARYAPFPPLSPVGRV